GVRCDCESSGNRSQATGHGPQAVPSHQSPVTSHAFRFSSTKAARNTPWRFPVQSKWRVACVRIPRFPIGAVWQHAIAEGKRSLPHTGANQAAKDEKASSNNHSKAEQLSLVSEDSARPTPRATSSSSNNQATGHRPKATNADQSPVT